MSCQVLNFQAHRVSYFQHILADLFGDSLRVALRAPGGQEFEVTGRNAGDRLIDLEGREYLFSEYIVEDIY